MTQQDFTSDRRKPVTWYCCGPTVYSHSHLGHARCYVVFDTMKRIMEREFGLVVQYSMNITDIDDKIINAAAEAGQSTEAVANYWEADFFDKMAALNVQMPDKVLRVSEHVPDILRYIERIANNGYAYEVEGSVYFDINKFVEDGYTYCKLRPNAFTADANEAYSPEDCPLSKRNPADFVLWKKSKVGEPFWMSKWGPGRPGWHIECSAMIQSILGLDEKLTIHSGGSDLMFPHHDNEIAQGEAHDCNSNWVEYFIHCAPLTIKGLKMSKSLKNFITIDEALKKVTGRQLRLLFLMHKYHQPMSFDPESSYLMAAEKDKYISEFVGSLESGINSLKGHPGRKQSMREEVLDHVITQAELRLKQTLAENFNTQGAIGVLLKLIKECNQYAKEEGLPNLPILMRLRRLITHITDTLGLDYRRPQLEASQTDTVDLIVEFRNRVLASLRHRNIHEAFSVCDDLRDIHLPKIGVKVEDGKQGWTTIETYRPPEDQGQHSYERHPADGHEERGVHEMKPGYSASLHDIGVSLFRSIKYDKFKIDQIDSTGMPVLDIDGREYAPKVVARFRRDLERELDRIEMDGR